MIRAVLFDLDGVLTLDKTGNVTTCRYFFEKLGVDYQSLFEYRNQFDEAIDRGKTNNTAVWKAIFKAHGMDLNPAWLKEANESTPIDEKMMGYVREFKKKCKVGIITDNEKGRVDDVSALNGWNGLFDSITISDVVGSTKADEPIYGVAMGGLGVKPNECVLIDNTMRNVEMARRVGMRGIYFDDERRDYGEIERLFISTQIKIL